MARDQHLPPKLEAVLARLCEQLGPLTKTKAVKLPYLVDVVAQHALGRRITEGTHQTWDYGVVTREVYRFITHGKGSSLFKIKPHNYSEGGLQIDLDRDNAAELADFEREVVDHVADCYGDMDAQSLGLLTKSLNVELDVSAWGSNHEATVDEDAYVRLSDSWQSLYKKLPALDFSGMDRWTQVSDPDECLRGLLGAQESH